MRALAVPFMLLVLLYFQRKRVREQTRANAIASDRLETADPSRMLQELLQIDIDDEADTPKTSFKDFVRGAPTRRLTAGLIAEVYHSAIGLIAFGFAAVVIIRSAIDNAIVAYVLIAFVAVPLAIALALRTRRARPSSGGLNDALARVLRMQELQYGAVIDRT